MESRPDGAARVVGDLMLPNPKTLPADAPVSEVRAMLENPSVQMVLLADGSALAGVVTELPVDAEPDQQALDFADREPETIGPDEPASVAFDRTAGNPHRRLVVVGENAQLLGLLCLDESRTRFCGAPGGWACDH
ncbi:MAG TPA: CBS domain-containing protein [Gaiellaceae bacterium]|jgi:CBS domain-containing protein